MTIEDIKSLMKSGDVAGAEAAAQELLTAEPDNVQAMMLYGTCRQLQGDEATFRDTYATVKAALDGKKVVLDAVAAAEWQAFGELKRKLDRPELVRRGMRSKVIPLTCGAIVLAVVILAVLFGVLYYDSSEIDPAQAMTGDVLQGSLNSLYAGPRTDEIEKRKSSAERAQKFKDTEQEKGFLP